ncbi:MAG: 50S ribosomal protein L7/L12 [Dehalococcoidia bacterium]
MATKKEDIVAAIEEMSVLDLADLVKTLEERLGVTAMAAAPVAAAAPAASAASNGASESGGGDEEAAEEVTIVLKEIGPNKINVIKAVREVVPGLGLKEAKDLVESAPKEIKENVPQSESDDIKKKLEDAGATVEIN